MLVQFLKNKEIGIRRAVGAKRRTFLDSFNQRLCFPVGGVLECF